MPSLRKDSRGRSPFWICCYTSATGQRLQKSTKITIKPVKGEKRKDGSPKTAADKRSEALEVCLATERAENHAKNGTLTEQQAKKIIGEIWSARPENRYAITKSATGSITGSI